MSVSRKFVVPLSVLGMLATTCLGPANAHDARPLYIEINELGNHLFEVAWKVPPSVPSFDIPSVHFPNACTDTRAEAQKQTDMNPGGRALYACPEGLGGRKISIVYPTINPSLSTLVRLRFLSGEEHSQVLGPQETVWQVPAAETYTGVAGEYTRLGINHIWTGVDHLLFLVCLLWIAGSLKRVLITITGFTLSHSVTLILSALKIVQLPVPPAEATIALSIVFLAREIAVGRRDNLTWRYPIAVSSSFGLLHGFGFAAALAETGLPQTELVPGLLFFNVGVEIGQVLFVVLVAGLFVGARSAVLARHHLVFNDFRIPARVSAGYAVGGLATFWLIERCLAFAS